MNKTICQTLLETWGVATVGSLHSACINLETVARYMRSAGQIGLAEQVEKLLAIQKQSLDIFEDTLNDSRKLFERRGE